MAAASVGPRCYSCSGFWTASLVIASLLAAAATAVGGAVTMTSGVSFVRSPQPIVAPPGDRVVFECETNVPAERVVWLHNGADMSAHYNSSNSGGTASNRRKGRRAIDDDAASFRMREVEGSSKSALHLILRINKNPHRYRQQAGDYQCVAWFGAVALTSLPARLSIAVLGDFPHLPPSFVTSLESESVQSSGPGRPTLRDNGSGLSSSGSVYVLEVFSGETAVLPCPPPPSDPPATITFFKDGKPVINNERVRLMLSGNLHVINVSSSDQGQYKCTAANHITGELIDGQRVLKLVVKGAPVRTKPATITWQPEERYISQIGHNVTLECAVTGWPKPQIRWIRDSNRPLPVGRSYYLGGGALVVTGLMDQDEGGYICEASNAAGPPLRSSTLLQLTEPVSIVKSPKDARVEEGARVSMSCEARGRPPPQQYWVFNGNAVSNDTHVIITDQQLTIINVTKRHAGIFQCFVSNSLSKVDGGAATLEVVPRSKVASSDSSSSSSSSLTAFSDEEEDDDLDSDSFFDPMTGTSPPAKHAQDAEKKGKGKGGKNRPREMIPPTRPNITRLTDESVMVRWSVPLNEGLPIEFFKVQYKESDKRGSRWKTIDEDIPSHIRSYEVSGLKSGQTYRFRIAAVYSNNDNKLGPNSSRFLLEKEAPKRKPGYSPLIEIAEAVSQSAIMIQWKYPELDSVPLEGFFIYYRSTTSAGDYTKVTVLGGNTRTHIVTHLLPETHYDLKMQSFNMQGTSEFSRIVTAKTQGSTIFTPSSSTNRQHNGPHRDSDISNSIGPLDVVSSDTAVTNDTLYVVLGSVLGGLTVLVVLLVALYHCRQRSAEREHDRSVWNGKPVTNENGNTITASPNHQYVHHHHHHKMHNGFADQHRPLYSSVDGGGRDHPDDHDETAETSFCDRTHRSSGDLLRSTDSLSRNSLKRGYIRNGSTPSLHQHHPAGRKVIDSNTLPLLMHGNGSRRDPCLDDAEWEASVPPADSEKFI
ncbi:interference hedgehog-like [Daphnia pulex]|uniref:interference hedgehog-like n=1 Tax=Daphnia pulex TaxID=6669 RepID=UPI001EDF1F19|nr:interference hedgehog-like [Daphnia pulex]